MNCQFCCPNTSSIKLPAEAPNTFAMPYTPPTRPSAIPRFSSGNAVPNSAVATGMMPPPPMACTARAASSSSKLPKSWARPQNSEPTPNSAMLVR